VGRKQPPRGGVLPLQLLGHLKETVRADVVDIRTPTSRRSRACIGRPTPDAVDEAVRSAAAVAAAHVGARPHDAVPAEAAVPAPATADYTAVAVVVIVVVVL
jgi:hypothetical protein